MTKLKALPYTDYPNVAKALSGVVWCGLATTLATITGTGKPLTTSSPVGFQ